MVLFLYKVKGDKMARYNKNVLRQQREKYNSAITSITTALKELETIKGELNDKTKYKGVSGIDDVKVKVESAISNLKTSKTNINTTITNLTTEINRPDEPEEVKEEV